MGDMELDDDEYDESDGDESDAEEGEVRAPRMKTVAAQTGGVREAGKKVKPRTTRVQRLGDATARLRVMTPFFQLVDMRDHIRQQESCLTKNGGLTNLTWNSCRSPERYGRLHSLKAKFQQMNQQRSSQQRRRGRNYGLGGAQENGVSTDLRRSPERHGQQLPVKKIWSRSSQRHGSDNTTQGRSRRAQRHGKERKI